MANRFTLQDQSPARRPPTEKRVARPLLFRGQWFDLDSYPAIVDPAEAIAASVLPDEPPIAAEPTSLAAEKSIERIELEGGPILERAPPPPP